MRLDERCRNIELILSDVDGVLTDGGVVFDNQGVESKQFHIRDGMGVQLWQRAGFRFGLVTGRSSQIVKLRAAELGIDLLRQGVADKRAAVHQIAHETDLTLDQIAFVGDDLPDLPVINIAGLAVAVADAADEVRQTAHYVTSLAGGHGAIRETVEMILKNKKRWDELIRKYQS